MASRSKICSKLFDVSKRLTSPDAVCKEYEAAVDALNGLQSNAQYLKNVQSKTKRTHQEEYANTILKAQKYLARGGISLDRLDELSVIHVTGSKGKGSTCAFCESILRHNGFRTGFFSSPHLIEVRERIKINGSPLSKPVFANYFWDLYNTLCKNKEFANDMPAYFMFLTILAFKIFLEEQVKVAVIEVGIGGEYDSTNVLRNVPVVGITPLDLEHSRILGNTLEEIAWQKSGIMKKNCMAFTVEQPKSVLQVFKERGEEKGINDLIVVNPDNLVTPLIDNSHFPFETTKMNASLAIALSNTWMDHCGIDLNENERLSNIKKGIINCNWPGRYQEVNMDNKKFYIDGAHTPKSIDLCCSWFMQRTKYSSNKRVLIFNTTAGRDSKHFLTILHKIGFDKIIFVPNSTKKRLKDNVNHNHPESKETGPCEQHKNMWNEIDKENNSKVFIYSCVDDAIYSNEVFNNNIKYDVLVTGSLHLVGAFLNVISQEDNTS